MEKSQKNVQNLRDFEVKNVRIKAKSGPTESTYLMF
jgi:hypothetical protein